MKSKLFLVVADSAGRYGGRLEGASKSCQSRTRKHAECL